MRWARKTTKSHIKYIIRARSLLAVAVIRATNLVLVIAIMFFVWHSISLEYYPTIKRSRQQLDGTKWQLHFSEESHPPRTTQSLLNTLAEMSRRSEGPQHIENDKIRDGAQISGCQGNIRADERETYGFRWQQRGQAVFEITWKLPCHGGHVTLHMCTCLYDVSFLVHSVLSLCNIATGGGVRRHITIAFLAFSLQLLVNLNSLQNKLQNKNHRMLVWRSGGNLKELILFF